MPNRIGTMTPGAPGKLGERPKAAASQAAGTGSGAASDAEVGPIGADTVELTGTGKLVAQAGEFLASTPDIDSARVADVRTAIANGDYVVNAEHIADALLRADLELDQ